MDLTTIRRLTRDRHLSLTKEEKGTQSKKVWKESHMDLPILDSNLQLFSYKLNALPTEVPGLTMDIAI